MPERKPPASPRRGLVIVYTGDGKGKTTAALGMALRGVGHGMRVLVVEFLKGRLDSGEREAARRLAPELRIVTSGDAFVPPDPAKWPGKTLRAVREGWAMAREAVCSGEYDMVVLDELCGAIYCGVIPVGDVLDLMRSKPPSVHLVITGRNAHRKLIEAADMVCHVRTTKHPFEVGVAAQPGIEY